MVNVIVTELSLMHVESVEDLEFLLDLLIVTQRQMERLYSQRLSKVYSEIELETMEEVGYLPVN